MADPTDAVSDKAAWVGDVLAFWFVELSRKSWFMGGPAVDEQVRARFLEVHNLVETMPIATLLADNDVTLAAIIVLDQFSRNMFRGTPRAFASDAKALALAEAVIKNGIPATFDADRRLFLYMPFEHSEDIDAQNTSVALISALGDAELTKYAEAHRDVIVRFGRFPHRNVFLGRTSTVEEIEFLKRPGSSF
jgi:uncharacterized protein (DUF924 family)